MHYLCLLLMAIIVYEDSRFQEINIVYLLSLLVTSYLHGTPNCQSVLFIIVFIIMWLLHYCGLADIFIIICISLHLDSFDLAISLMISCLLAMIHFAIIKRNHTIPFTPYLISGYLVVTIFQMLH